MKRQMIVAMIVGGMLIALPATAQQKLGDVAGSIKLKKAEGESVVINDSGVGRNSPRSTTSSDTDLLHEVMNDCLDAARGLLSFLNDSPRIMPVVYSDDFLNQLDEFDGILGDVAQELQMLPDAGPSEAAYQKAVRGMDEVRQGFDLAVETVNRNRLVSSVSNRQVWGGANTIEEAMTEVRAIERTQAAAAPAPAIDPIAAAASIRRLCGRLGEEGSQAYRSCVEDQDSAKEALVGRTGPAVGLDASAFNKIRNGCSYEWPDNYVNRDACERRRADAAKTW